MTAGRGRESARPGGSAARAAPASADATPAAALAATRANAAGTPAAAATPLHRIAVLTRDADLLAVLRTSAPQVAVASATAPPELADLLLSHSCRALVLDSACIGGALVAVVEKLAVQFPELPLVVVGVRADETVVSRLLSTGMLYRFLHRPVSPERARAFMAAALRRRDEIERGAGAASPPDTRGSGAREFGRDAGHAAAVPPAARTTRTVPARAAGSARGVRAPRTTATPRWRTPLALGAAAVALAAVAVVVTTRPAPPASSAPASTRSLPAGAAVASVPAPPAAAAAPTPTPTPTPMEDRERAAAHERLVALTRAAASAAAAPPAGTDAPSRGASTAAVRESSSPPAAPASPTVDTTPEAPSIDASPSTALSFPPAPDAALAPAVAPEFAPPPAPVAPIPASSTSLASAPVSSAPLVRPPLRKLVDAPPAYPARARAQNLEGWVDVAFTVGASGRPENVRVMTGQPQGVFDAAAVAAVRDWRYAAPAAPQDANVRVRFRLGR